MKQYKKLAKIIYLLVCSLVLLALINILYNIRTNLDYLETIIVSTANIVVPFIISTLTILLILVRLDRISKYNIPQVVIMKILYFKNIIILIINVVLVSLLALLVLYIEAEFINIADVWLVYTIIEVLLVIIAFQLIHILFVTVKLMYNLKVGINIFDAFYDIRLSEDDFLNILSSVEGNISKVHAKELVLNILDHSKNSELRANVINNLDYKKISQIYNFEVKYQLFKLWWNERSVALIIDDIKTRDLSFKEMKYILNDYEQLIITYISDDIRKTTFYKYEKQYLIEKFLTELFVVIEENIEELEYFKLYVFLYEYLDNMIAEIIKKSSKHKSELVKYYVEFLVSRNASFTNDIWFDIICENLFVCEANNQETNVAMLKCLLNTCKKHTAILYEEQQNSYKLHISNKYNSHFIKCSEDIKLYFENKDLINKSTIKYIIDSEVQFLKKCSVTDYCYALLTKRGFKNIGEVDYKLKTETKYSNRIYDLAMEANNKIIKASGVTNDQFLFLSDTDESELSLNYLKRIEVELKKHLQTLESYNYESGYEYAFNEMHSLNTKYYKAIKIMTTYARINLNEKSSKKSLVFLESLNKEDHSIILENVFTVLSQANMNAKYNLMNSLLFVYLNFAYYSKIDFVNEVKYANIDGIESILTYLQNVIINKQTDYEIATEGSELLQLLLTNNKLFIPYVNYKHIISSIESEKFKRRKYIIYGIEFNELFNA